MARMRRHQRLLAALAFALLALVVELVGWSLTRRIDRALHVSSPISNGASYYPLLLAGVKIGVALLLARLAWRFVRARSLARAGTRVLRAVGARPAQGTPRVKIRLSPRLWLAFFAATALCYLTQTDVERVSAGRWPLLAPWLHTYALPVFAVLAVLAAVVWGAVSRWLADYESYAEATFAHARRLVAATAQPPRRYAVFTGSAPRARFGLAFECRPPPLAVA
jgi:hypothetical protein